MSLFQVACIAVTSPAANAASVALQPQFEAGSDKDVLEKHLPEWLEKTGYRLVEGSTPTVTKVEPPAKPEPEPKPGARRTHGLQQDPTGPMSSDGKTRLPTREQYVAAGYEAKEYDRFIEVRTSAKPGELIVGTSRNAQGATYMGKDSNGQPVWDEQFAFGQQDPNVTNSAPLDPNAHPQASQHNNADFPGAGNIQAEHPAGATPGGPTISPGVEVNPHPGNAPRQPADVRSADESSSKKHR